MHDSSVCAVDAPERSRFKRRLLQMLTNKAIRWWRRWSDGEEISTAFTMLAHSNLNMPLYYLYASSINLPTVKQLHSKKKPGMEYWVFSWCRDDRLWTVACRSSWSPLVEGFHRHASPDATQHTIHQHQWAHNANCIQILFAYRYALIRETQTFGNYLHHCNCYYVNSPTLRKVESDIYLSLYDLINEG